MSAKWFGAILIVLACSGCGFSMAASHLTQERTVRALIAALEFMESDLRYRLTPLPELCDCVGSVIRGQVGDVFVKVSQRLQQQTAPDVAVCMAAAVADSELDGAVRKHLLTLGETLGRFDLDGQLRGIEAVQSECRRTLEKLYNHRESRLRSYQTLGLCAGAALAILLI